MCGRGSALLCAGVPMVCNGVCQGFVNGPMMLWVYRGVGRKVRGGADEWGGWRPTAKCRRLVQAPLGDGACRECLYVAWVCIAALVVCSVYLGVCFQVRGVCVMAGCGPAGC